MCHFSELCEFTRDLMVDVYLDNWITLMNECIFLGKYSSIQFLVVTGMGGICIHYPPVNKHGNGKSSINGGL